MIPFNDFKRHYQAHHEADDRAMQGVLESGRYILGEQVEAFEREFAEYLGAACCVGVASGTEAIALALMAAGVRPGDEVITAGMTAYPTITGIMQAGAVPVVVDVNLDDGLIDPRNIDHAVTEKTRAIVPVHLYGQCADMDAVAAVAGRFGIAVIEDAAQAAGAEIAGRKAGGIGLCGAFSFYPTKNLGAFGDGGAVVTGSAELGKKLRLLRNYGMTAHAVHDAPGINSRLDEVQAAVLRVKLRMLDGWNNRRREIAAAYRSGITAATPLAEREYGRGNGHLFVVRHGRRDDCVGHLRASGIQSLIHYPVPVFRQKAFAGRVAGTMAACEELCRTVFSLPVFPELTGAETQRVIEVLNECR